MLLTIAENTPLAGSRDMGAKLKIGLFLSRGADIVRAACAAVENVDVVQFADASGLQSRIADFDAIVIQNTVYNANFARQVAETGKLRWIQAAASGIDAFERHGVRAGITVTNAGDTWAPCVADHAMALLLALMRGIPLAEKMRADGRWDQPGVGASLVGLRGRKMLVIGLGAIGEEVSRRASAFGMQVEAVTRSAKSAPHGVQEVYGLERLTERLAKADAVVLSLPLTPQSTQLINRATLGVMKRSAFLINVSRGGVIDEAALLEALEAGHLAGVGLDVAETEPLPTGNALWSAPRTIITPHVAAFDDGPGFELLAKLCGDNAMRFRDREPLMNRIVLR